jgi:hypothetical protein
MEEDVKIMTLLALTLMTDPEQPYARSARPAQHHDAAKPITLGIFSGFSGSPGADACRMSHGEAGIIQFDPLASRWIYARPAADPANGMYYQCAAVSASSDAGGAWHRYVFESRLASAAPAVNDQPLLAVWPDAYYVSQMMRAPQGGAILGAQVCGYERPAMLAGLPAAGRCVDFGPAYGRILFLWRFSFTDHAITGPVRTCTSH